MRGRVYVWCFRRASQIEACSDWARLSRAWRRVSTACRSRDSWISLILLRVIFDDFHIGHYLRDLITKICRVTIGDLLFCLGGVLLNLLQLRCNFCGDHTQKKDLC